jgi:FkbM family methyltransferase
VRIFLDVGANTGQTLAAVQELDQFDRIYSFEPVSVCWPYLTKIAGLRTQIERFGLWDRNARAPLFDPGTKGAGMWLKDKRRADRPVTTEVCEFRRASEWFAEHIALTDVVHMKLNCEGCECDILDDLLDSGQFSKVSFAMIDFDARKIAAIRHREAELRARLEQYPAPRVMFSRVAMVGDTHRDRIHHWIGLTKS